MKVPKHDEKTDTPESTKICFNQVQKLPFASILFVNGLGLRKYFIPGCNWAGGQVGF